VPDAETGLGVPDLPRGTQNRLSLPCVRCRRSLPPAPWETTTEHGFRLDDVAECSTCGLRYSGELLRTAHPEMWAFIMLNRLFCSACGHDHVVLVYSGDHGQPIPCPTHGPDPEVAYA
jgi:hypothetical protein